MRVGKIRNRIAAIVSGVAVLMATFAVLISPTPALASYYTIDSSLLIPKSVYAAEFDEFIRAHHPESLLIGHGQMWINAQSKYGIDAVYLMSHAMLESAWGTSEVLRDHNNLFGYGAFDDGSEPYTFASYEDCVDKVAGWIFEDYLSPTGGYYKPWLGPTLRGMNTSAPPAYGYATDPLWGSKICSVMNEFYQMFPFQPQSPPDSFWTRGYVKQIYRNVLKREAGPTETDAWYNSMMSSYLSRRLMAMSVMDSPEGNGIFVRYSLYRDVLGRDPMSVAQPDVDGYVNRLLAGASEEHLTAEFYASSEYYSTRGGSTNSGFIIAVYADMLGRTPSQSEINPWVAAIVSSDREIVAGRIMSTVEAARRFIAAQYLDKLLRPGPTADVAAWAVLMTDQSFPLSRRQVKYNFISGEEFMYLGANPFLDSIYVSALGRTAGNTSSNEMASWRGAMASGLPRGEVASRFIGSTEAKTLVVRSIYTSVLGRTADAGAAGWVGLMNQGVSERRVNAYFYGSDEYFQTRAANNMSNYVSSIYVAILSRSSAPNASEINLWVNSGLSRDEIAFRLLSSGERLMKYADSVYRDSKYLGRVPQTVETAIWAAAMANGLTEEQFKAALIGSDEYASKHL